MNMVEPVFVWINFRPDPPVVFSSYPDAVITVTSSSQVKSLGFDSSRKMAFSRLLTCEGYFPRAGLCN